MTAPHPTGRARPGLSVVVTDARGRALPAGGLAAFLARAAPRRARGTVVIALVSDAAMRRLNRQFRGIDRPTDVLSFEGGPAGPGCVPGAGLRPARQFGDIVIARAVEWRILALHGLLHLLGYDHHGDQGEMRRVEERLRRRAGLPVGLTARAAGTEAR
jgi:probable rRNA maturation factor